MFFCKKVHEVKEIFYDNVKSFGSLINEHLKCFFLNKEKTCK
jgi:hypothetical protein